jgi:hypothetical protein
LRSYAKDRKQTAAEIEAWETFQELLESTEKDNLQKLEQQRAAKESVLARLAHL